MRPFLIFLPFLLAGQTTPPDRDLGGAWKLVPEKSQVRDASPAPTGFIKITQTTSAITMAASPSEGESPTVLIYLLGGKSGRYQAGDLTTSIVTKWEGPALLANVIVSGRVEYSMRERWERAADGSRLTVTRTVTRANSESDSVLVYDNANTTVTKNSELPATAPAPRATALIPRPSTPASAPATAPDILVAAGTRILLRLTNAVNTKHTVAGDRLYLETAIPVFIDRQLVIPARSYVTATVIESRQAGRVKGLSALNLRFDTLTLPNGVTRDFRAMPGSVDGHGNLDRTEGAITGEGTKGKDARTVGKTTGAGAGIGTLAGAAAGHAGMGAGIGAAAGALGGLAGVLSSRGADVSLPAGTSMEMILDRDLNFTRDEIRPRVE